MAWSRVRVASDGSSHFTGYYRSPEGRTKSAGTYPSRRAALRAAGHFEHKVIDGSWIDPALGQITFREYVEEVWFPSRHLELSTRQAYTSILNHHFLPYFGDLPMKRIMPSTVQAWVTKVSVEGRICPNTIKKNHVMLHSVFRRAVRDRIITFNPCSDTELPKIIRKETQTMTPEEYARLYAAIPERYQDFVQTCIETGLRWGELVALRSRHIDFLRRTVSIEETIVELSKKHSPTGERNIVKPYPKNNKPRVIGLRQGLLDRVAARIQRMELGRDDLLFPSTDVAGGAPISATPSARRSGFRPSRLPGSASTSGCTTSDTPTPRGCSQAVPTWSASWSAWVTRRSRPLNAISTHSPTPTTKTSTRSAASPIGRPALPGRRGREPNAYSSRATTVS